MAVSNAERNRAWRDRCQQAGIRQLVVMVPDVDRGLVHRLAALAKQRAMEGLPPLSDVLVLGGLEGAALLVSRPRSTSVVAAAAPAVPMASAAAAVPAGHRHRPSSPALPLLGAPRGPRPLPTDF